jgi:hypothetical protein
MDLSDINSTFVEYVEENTAVLNTIVAKQIAALRSVSDPSAPIDLFLGATGSIKLNVGGSNTLVIQQKSSDNNVQFKATSGQMLEFQPGDALKTVRLGDLIIRKNQGLQQITSDFSNIEIATNLQVKGTELVDGDLLINGGFLANSLNIVRSSNQSESEQVGFGFRVSDEGNLELYKFDSTTGVTKRVMTFGKGEVVGSNDINEFPLLGSGSSNIGNTIYLQSNAGGGGGGDGSDSGGGSTVGWAVAGDAVYAVKGFVGLGTSNPQATLDVVGDIYVTGDIYRNGIRFNNNPWNASSSALYAINKNVGIGTTAPTSALDVRGDITVGGHILPLSNEVYDLGSANARFRDLFLSGNTIDMAGLMLQKNSEGNLEIRDRSTNSLRRLVVNEIQIGTSNDYVAIKKDPSNQVRIQRFQNANNITPIEDVTGVPNLYSLNSNIGIGKSNPAYPLDVQGSINVSGGYYVNGQPLKLTIDNLYSVNSNIGIGTTAPQGVLHVVAMSNNTSNDLFVVKSNGYVGLGTSNPVQPFELQHSNATLVFTSNCRLGIGTSNPESTLHVVGSIRSTSLTPDTILVTNSSNEIISSSVALSNLSYLLGARSNIQGQLDEKLSIYGGTVTGPLTIQGDLTVNGTTFTVNTTQLLVEDNLITINKNQTGIPSSNLRSGIEVERGSLSNYYFVFEEATQLFKVGLSNQLQAVATRLDTMQNRAVTIWDSNLNCLSYDSNVVIDQDGRLGVGTSNPQARLDVRGDVSIAGNLVPASNAAYDIGSTQVPFGRIYLGSNGAMVLGSNVALRSSGSNLRVFNPASNALQSAIFEHVEVDNGSNVYRTVYRDQAVYWDLVHPMNPEVTVPILDAPVVDNLYSVDNFIGIGTSNPSYLLDVAGTLRASNWVGLPVASLSNEGIVSLSSSLSNDSSNVAATAGAVKAAYDIIVQTNTFLQNLNLVATSSNAGLVRIYDGVDSSNDTVAATANAVRIAYDKAIDTSNDIATLVQDATFTEKGTVRMYNTVDISSNNYAATAGAVKQAYDKAVDASNLIDGRFITAFASTSNAGIVQLYNDVDSSNATWAATANAARLAYDLAFRASNQNYNHLGNGVDMWIRSTDGINRFLFSNNGPTYYSSGNFTHAWVGSDNSNLLFLNSNGSLVASGDVTAFSDSRLKRNITQLEGALDMVKKLRGVKYTMLNQPDEIQVGLIAQEVEPIVPEVVKTEPTTGMKTIAYGNLIAVAVEALKELHAKVEAL